MIKQFEAVIQRAVEKADGVEPPKHSDGRTIYRAIATTPALDRYGEVVLPKGAMIDNFMKNPVLLENHNYAASSVGHVVGLSVEDSQVLFDFVFSTDQRGVDLEQKFVAGDMNAFSIGFRPKAKMDLWAPWDEAPEVKEVTVEYPDGSEGVVDLRGYEQVPYRLYNKWELLEISPVAVPANPEALLLRQAEEIIRRTMEQNPVMKSFVQEQLADVLNPAMKMLEDFAAKFDGEVKFEGAVASHKTPVIEGTWSGSSAKAALAKYASSDGTGSKDKMNWSKYSKGFAWFDSKKADSFGAYKLPHHTIKDGKLVAIWSGVAAAMAALLGARGGVELTDKEAVYAHLAKHYKDHKKEPPEMKEYSDDELLAIAAEPLVTGKKAADEEDPSEDESTDETDESTEEEDEDTEEDAKEDESEEETEDKSNIPTPNTLMASMGQMMTMIQKVLDTVMILVQKSEINENSYEQVEEHFMEVLLKMESMSDTLDYNLGKAKKKDAAPVQKEVVGEISADLVGQLERLAL